MNTGQLVNERYQLDAPLGTGGFSEVWRAIDSATGLPVAVKLPRAGREPEANARLREEAAILASLNHPNLVRVLDSGTERGQEFLVMELIEGPTLRDVISESAPLSNNDVLAVGADLADALAQAHAQGLVHGDIKPENIIMSHGVPRLIDFGTAKNLSDTLAPEEVRQIAGTLAYLAPELLTGERLSPQSDIYALGVTLYEARSGRLPFAGGGGMLAGSEGRRASPLRTVARGVDSRLESAIMQSLAIDPAWRPASASEVRARLSNGGHDTVPLRPQRGSASDRGAAPLNREAAAWVAPAATTMTRGPGARYEPPARASFPKFEDWAESQHSRQAPSRRLVAMAAAFALLVLFGAVALQTIGSSDQSSPAGDGESSFGASIDGTETATATAAPNTATITATPDRRTATASPTATREQSTPAAVPPTGTPPPPTAAPPSPTRTAVPATSTSPSVQEVQVQLDRQSGPGTVVQWYRLLVAGDYDAAYALWSERMKQNFPRQGNLDGRWANTASVLVNDVRVVSQSMNRMTVAIDFVETLDNGATRRYAGSWQLVAGPSGWLLDQPSF